jgi:hypothetical protein
MHRTVPKWKDVWLPWIFQHQPDGSLKGKEANAGLSLQVRSSHELVSSPTCVILETLHFFSYAFLIFWGLGEFLQCVTPPVVIMVVCVNPRN